MSELPIDPASFILALRTGSSDNVFSDDDLSGFHDPYGSLPPTHLNNTLYAFSEQV